MSYQPGMTHHTTRPNWVGTTLLVMKIAPILWSPDPRYLRGQNNSDLLARVRPCSGRAKVTPWRRSTWITRNRAKQIITAIRLCQEKKTCSHKQRHTSTQRQKSGDPSQRYENTIDGQSRRRSKITGEIIIKEERIQKVSQQTLSFKQKKIRERRGLLGWEEKNQKENFGRENWIPTKDSGRIQGTKIPKERLLEISPHR